jgi:tetratricopeptide (TPR) repeat protein
MCRFTFLLSWAALLLSACGLGDSPDRRREAALVYLRAKDLYLAGYWDEALTLLREQGGRDEGFSAPQFLAGKILFLKKDHAGAEAAWRNLLVKNPHHGETRKWLARLRLLQGRAREAEDVVAPALSDDPEDVELLILVGKSRLLGGDTAGAVEYFTKAKACFERLAEAPLELADLYLRFGLRRRSIEELELAAAMLGKDSTLLRSVSGSIEFLKKEVP